MTVYVTNITWHLKWKIHKDDASHERIVEQTKEDYYEVLKAISSGWHEGKNNNMPWFNYLLSTWRRAYREFEERADRQQQERGSKTDLVEYALRAMTTPPSGSPILRGCAPTSAVTRSAS